MESRKHNAGIHDAQMRPTSEIADQDKAAWTIRKLIDILDDAIDTAGTQFARSAGLWADSPTPFDERGRSVRRRRPPSTPTESVAEEPDTDRSISPM
jgi:hypothetical protein